MNIWNNISILSLFSDKYLWFYFMINDKLLKCTCIRSCIIQILDTKTEKNSAFECEIQQIKVL